MVQVESGLNCEQDSLMRPMYIEYGISVMEQVVLIARVVLIMPPLKKRGVYCFANVGRSVGRPNGFR